MKFFLGVSTLVLSLSVSAFARSGDRTCSNLDYREVVSAAKKELSRELRRDPGATGIGLTNCPAYWSAMVLGKSKPLKRRPDECGINVNFADEEAMIAFAQEYGSNYEFERDGQLVFVRLCGKVTGDIEPL